MAAGSVAILALSALAYIESPFDLLIHQIAHAQSKDLNSYSRFSLGIFMAPLLLPMRGGVTSLRRPDLVLAADAL